MLIWYVKKFPWNPQLFWNPEIPSVKYFFVFLIHLLNSWWIECYFYSASSDISKWLLFCSWRLIDCSLPFFQTFIKAFIPICQRKVVVLQRKHKSILTRYDQWPNHSLFTQNEGFYSYGHYIVSIKSSHVKIFTTM